MRSVHMPITIVMIQMAFTVLLLCAYPCGLHFGSLKDVIRWSVSVPWLFAVMLASSMLSLRYSSMGAIVVVRNMSPLVSLCLEGLFTGEHIEIDVWTLLSLLVILGGVVLYVSHDITFSPIGMLCMVANLAAGVSATAALPARASVTPPSHPNRGWAPPPSLPRRALPTTRSLSAAERSVFLTTLSPAASPLPLSGVGALAAAQDDRGRANRHQQVSSAPTSGPLTHFPDAACRYTLTSGHQSIAPFRCPRTAPAHMA
jgi:hypothetical protein